VPRQESYMLNNPVPAYPIAQALVLSKAAFSEVCRSHKIEKLTVDRTLFVSLDDVIREFPDIKDEATYWAFCYRNNPTGVVNLPLWTDLEHAGNRRAANRSAGIAGWGRA
jgi:hypothetical protein